MSIKQNKKSKHSFFMSLALLQAYKCLGNTKENPAVGCVIVKEGSIISAGFTGKSGRPHAEFNAINNSNKNIKNSDLYVTLEPCSHYGKTPPCVNNIIKSKIKRVYFSVKDPDVRTYNKSKNRLKKSKIDVKDGFLLSETKNFYKSYFKFKNSEVPFVTGKIAISKDYYTINRKKRWITNQFSRGRVHFMRSIHDCILTGINTVIKDNPDLTCRIPGLENNSPTRIILDKNLKIPMSSNILKNSNRYQTIIFYNKSNNKIDNLKKLRIKVIKSPLDSFGNFDLKKVLLKIKKLGFSRIFLESGIKLTYNFLSEKLIDDFKLFISDRKIGSNGRASFKKCMNVYLNNKKFINEKVNLFGDKLLTYRLK